MCRCPSHPCRCHLPIHRQQHLGWYSCCQQDPCIHHLTNKHGAHNVTNLKLFEPLKVIMPFTANIYEQTFTNKHLQTNIYNKHLQKHLQTNISWHFLTSAKEQGWLNELTSPTLQQYPEIITNSYNIHYLSTCAKSCLFSPILQQHLHFSAHPSTTSSQIEAKNTGSLSNHWWVTHHTM